MKKVVKLTENDLARIVKRVIRENEGETKESIGWGHSILNEQYLGHVTIKITGHGDIKDVMVNDIIDVRNQYQGAVELFIDGEKYNFNTQRKFRYPTWYVGE